MSKKFLFIGLLLSVYIPVVSMQVTPENYMFALRSEVSKLGGNPENSLTALKNISTLLSDIPATVDKRQIKKETEIIPRAVELLGFQEDHFVKKARKHGFVGGMCAVFSCFGISYGPLAVIPTAIAALFCLNSARVDYKKSVAIREDDNESKHIIRLLNNMHVPSAQKID